MADWNNPVLTSTYVNFLAEMKARDTDLAVQFDGVSPSNIPTGTIRWSSSANRWQKWTGSTWGELTGTYALTALTTTGNVSVGGNLTVTGSVSFTSTAATATTQAVDNNSTSVATTAFVVGQAGSAAPNANGTVAVGTSLRYARQDHVHPADTSRAPLASPTFTGTPVVPSLNSGQLGGFRNRIINGSMEHDRRNLGATVTCAAGNSVYPVDRWAVYAAGGAVTAARAAIGQYGFATALRVTGGAGNTYVEISHKIESYHCLDLTSKVATLSFYAASSVARTLNWNLSYANSTDVFATVTSIASGTVSSTTAYTLYSFPVTISAGASTGIKLIISASSGLTSGSFDIFGVQLELGNQATPYERRSRGIELALCQRYFYAPKVTYTHQAYGANGTNSYANIFFPVQMRTIPTISASWGSLVACTGSITGALDEIGASAGLLRTSAGAGDFAGAITWNSFSAEL